MVQEKTNHTPVTVSKTLEKFFRKGTTQCQKINWEITFYIYLSKKTSLKYSEFKKHIEYLYKDTHNHIDHIPYSQIFRGLSSLGYMDIGQETRQGTTVVQVAPPALVELPFMQHTFLLTGMRTPELLKIFKNSILCVKVTSHKYLPDTVLVYPEDELALKHWLNNTSFQGNKLSAYIKVCDRPVAWDILDFAGDLK